MAPEPSPHLVTRRGIRSEDRESSQLNRYLAPEGPYEKGQEKIESITETFTVPEFPGHFLPHNQNVSDVQELIAKKFPGDPISLPNLSDNENNILIVQAPPLSNEQLKLVGPGQMPRYIVERTKSNPGIRTTLDKLGAAPFLLIRHPEVLSPKVQELLWNAWITIIPANPRYPEEEYGHSSTPALYLGI
ncbi:hypothetical protein DFH09DRAFT_1073641 [Mycena vulgaris]|nr:hypothetical protein DFH09DRAFT_1073641 [Mycena vulgaris]